MCETTLTLVKPVRGQPLSEAEKVVVKCWGGHDPALSIVAHQFNLPEGYYFPDGRQMYMFAGLAGSFNSSKIFFWPCFHMNYGSLENPSSVFGEFGESKLSCSVCGYMYCESCNYDTHKCFGCGEYIGHDEEHSKCFYD